MKSTACESFRRSGCSRRSFLLAGSLGVAGPNLTQLLAAGSGTANGKPKVRSCILLYMFGGPSHLDTFDVKPSAPAEVRGEFASIASRTPGSPVCEHLPRLAALSDKYALIRSMCHQTSNHNPASYYALTGHPQRTDNVTANATANDFPAYGSVVSKFAPAGSDVPSFVSLPTMIADGPFRTPGEFAGYLGKLNDPLWILQDPNRPNFRVDQLRLPEGLDAARLDQRRQLRQQLGQQAFGSPAWTSSSDAIQGMRSYYERAYDLLNSDRTRHGLSIDKEPASVRDRYGRTTFGQSTLLARRLVEAGVRVVTVFYSPGIGGWDTHDSNFVKLKGDRLPIVDTAVSALLEDLQQRGLLDETLVLWMGEFGRSPKINDKAGRDHWPRCYTAMLAGGGIPGGLRYGESDSVGAYPKDKPVHPEDLSATLFARFGIDPHRLVTDQFGRGIPLSYGEPVAELL